jgi:glycosyltransferase involved in cell wall biosynthesis
LLEIMARAGIFLQHQPLAANGQGGVSAKNGVTASAMALGLAIITTAGDMTDRQFFRHGQNCWLLENAGALQWEAAIQALLDEPALGRRLGSAARASFLQHLTWASIAESVHVHLLQPV